MAALAELCAEIEASLRAAEGAGYNERMDALWRAGELAQRLRRTVTSVSEARTSRSIFLRVLAMPLVGGCTPACCNASSVRWSGILAKVAVLRTWASLDPEAIGEAPREAVVDLLRPDSRRISGAAAEILSRAPQAIARHLEAVCAAIEHPRWQVVEPLARGLGRLPSPPAKTAVRALRRASVHAHPQVRRTAARALERLGLAVDG